MRVLLWLFLLSFILQSCWSENIGAISGSSEDLTVSETIFGRTLYTWESRFNEAGEEEMVVYSMPTNDLISKDTKYIGIYFSASWCGPCRKFTPILAKFYKELKSRKEPFEIVWVSADRTSDEFFNYYKEMPWKAVPSENIRLVYEALAAKCEVKGIPHFTIIEVKSGHVVTNQGREKVLEDPYGLQFPWKSFPFVSKLGDATKGFLSRQIGIAYRQFSHTLRAAFVGLWGALSQFIRRTISSR